MSICESKNFVFLACNCHNTGAQDAFCDVQNGACSCNPSSYGRRCDECKPGYWNFPNCEPCECNSHALTCNSTTGECIDCNEYTDGFHCEVCR